MGGLLVVGIVLWFWLGDPQRDVADWFWPATAAPWESVDAFYYPDRGNLTVHQERRGLDSIKECRVAVRTMALEFNDIALIRGDYECGVGELEGRQFGGITVYRITAE